MPIFSSSTGSCWDLLSLISFELHRAMGLNFSPIQMLLCRWDLLLASLICTAWRSRFLFRGSINLDRSPSSLIDSSPSLVSPRLLIMKYGMLSFPSREIIRVKSSCPIVASSSMLRSILGLTQSLSRSLDRSSKPLLVIGSIPCGEDGWNVHEHR